MLFASLPFTIPTAQLSEEKASLTAAAEPSKKFLGKILGQDLVAR